MSYLRNKQKRWTSTKLWTTLGATVIKSLVTECLNINNKVPLTQEDLSLKYNEEITEYVNDEINDI